MSTSTLLHRSAALCVAVCVDVCVLHASNLVPTHGLAAHLLRHWLTAALRLSALSVWSLLVLGHFRPVLVRLIAAHCLLPAVLESGSAALNPDDGGTRAPADALGLWLRGAAASLAAALFWEIGFPERHEAAAGSEERHRARGLFLRVLRLYRPHYPLLFGGFVFLSLAVLFEMFIPFYTGRVIDILGGRYQLNEFGSALLFMGLFSVGSSVSAGCRGGLLLCAISAFTCRIKVMLFGALTKQEIGFFENVKTGEITNRLSVDTTLMARTVCLNVNVLLRTLIKTLGMISLMMTLSWKLTFLVLMETPVTGLIQSIHDTHMQRLTLAIQDSMASANEAASEVMSGIRVVRSFKAETHEARRYGDRLANIQALKARRDFIGAVRLLVARLTGLAMQVVMLYFGRMFIQSGQMTTGNLLSFILYQSDLGDNIRTLAYSVGDMLNSVGAAGKVFEYLDRKPQVGTEGKLKPNHLSGHVRFDRLSFSYPSNPGKAVLQDFSVELKPGQMTALVGPSGEGKSTCVGLLERFYEPQEGEILLDKEPLRSYDHHFLHKKVAVVSQDPVLFSGSIRDNIAYGLADCSLEEIQEAARQANAHHFITLLAKGYDTEVGEGGGQLSKSEKQRIAIARALVRQPQVLILDEITSSLDYENQNKVQQNLASRPNQTLLVIAHKLETIECADQIIVIGGGRVEERGTHQELMEQKGRYYKLVEKLFTGGTAAREKTH